MTRFISKLRRSVIPVLAIAVSAMLFTACLKNKDDNNSNIPAAGLMAFNLAPDQQSVVIRLSGNMLTAAPLGFNNYNGFYQNIYPGNRSVESFDYPNSTPLASTSFNFELNKYYSVFVTGVSGNYKNVVSADNLDSLATTGNAYIRYVNAITDSVNTPTVTIAAGGNNVVNENAAYASVSEFKTIAPGSVVITVKNGGTIDANRTITIDQNKIYTVLLAGIPGSTDDSKKVQIKFIQNGTLTGDSK